MGESVDFLRAHALRNDALHLILMPTEKCNFRCVYCYEDFSLGRMPDWVQLGIKRLLDKRVQDLSVLQIGWFGGEPTLCTDIITDINSYVLHLKSSLNPELEFSSSISTNGALLARHIFAALVAVNVKMFQITLDGDDEEHNKTRITMRRAGTFETIFRNVLLALEIPGDFKIALRLHVHDNNIESLDRLLSRIETTFGGDSRLTVYFKAIEPLAENHTPEVQFLTRVEEVDALKRRALNMGILERDADTPMCYAAKANSLVVRSDGRIAKCTVAFRDARNTVGTLDTHGNLIIDRGAFMPWIAGTLSGDENAMSCPLHSLNHAISALRS
jgi:uncharacterized protein